jgi:tetratricopeptide (TPR) repeat protein
MMKHTMKTEFFCALAALAMVGGCGSLEVGHKVQAGRNALQTGQPETAIAYLAQAAALDPAYKTPYRLGQSVLTFLGRAYYETGKDKEARDALEQALTRDSSDSLAHLYLGLALLRSGERERGGHEIQTGLKTLHEDIDDLAADNIWGSYWDPARQIRGDIRRAAALSTDSPELPVLVQRIGKSTDEEPDRVRREESRTLYGRAGDS